MPENEFEKKVSSEMEGLKFKPSENVWLHVEERIRKKNKRRVFVIIFLLAGLALLGYWQRSNLFGEKGTSIVTIEKPKENSSDISNENNEPTNKQNTDTKNEKESSSTNEKVLNDKTTEAPVVDKKDILISKNEIITPEVGKKDESKIKPVPAKTQKAKESDVSIDVGSSKPQKSDPVIVDAKIKDTVTVRTDTGQFTKKDQTRQPDVIIQDNKIDSAGTEQKKNNPEKPDTILKTEPTKVLPTPNVKNDSSKKRWVWGLHLTPGISSLNDNSISFSELKHADALSYQNPVGSGAGNPPARQRPSDVKAGFAFQAGAFAQKQLSTRTSFSVGLQYGYYSNVIRIGNLRDSLLSNSQFSNVLDTRDDHVYNAGGDAVKFTNQYHFIELPLRFQWQWNKSKTNPFVWSAGFTVGQLIASNALMYDTAFNGIYYKNNKLLNKTQFSLSTGFSWTIANGKRTQWSLGPVANIHLNRLVENPFESKRYLFFAGLRTSILFHQKK